MLNKKKLKRELLARDIAYKDIKVAVLCGGSTGELVDELEIKLLENGIRPSFMIGDYNRYYEEALYGTALKDFAPDLVYVHTTRHNIVNLPKLSDTVEESREALEREFARWRSIIESCVSRFGCMVIQNNFDPPDTRPLGNLDGIDPRGHTAFITALNMRLAEFAMTQSSLIVQDIAYLAAKAGITNWYDPTYMYLYKYAVSVPLTPVLAESLAHIIGSIYGKRKKCLVLDLDNTLWGGIVGEVGPEHIQIGSDSPQGEAFAAFQQYLRHIADTGVVLCVASKNDDAAARGAFTAPGMILKLDDFISFHANWGPKSESIKKIAVELNLGLDSFVFIDDNPAERELVRTMLPEVSVPEASKPDEFIAAIENAGYFEAVTLSAEDQGRVQMYRDNITRRNEQAAFENYDDYLRSLLMTAVFAPVSPANIERAAQLLEKTNQFNLTGYRPTVAELTSISNDSSSVTVCGRLTDKFGDNGLVTVCIAHHDAQTLHIDSWVMSCRVFSRHLEYAVFDELVRLCGLHNIRQIAGVYRPTAKNKPFIEFYASLGFKHVGDDGGASLWQYTIPEIYDNKNCVIQLEGRDA